MCPKGLLFTTQFAQVALVIMSCAAFEDLCLKGFDAAFAGHLLGEFSAGSALASVTDILPNSSLVDVVFYHGLTMQHAVKRDE
jgi:malonyl CoA-acyl carrier protein transacylase